MLPTTRCTPVLHHTGIVVSPSIIGPSGGQQWDIGAGRRTSAVVLRNQSTSRSCTCSCPAGYSGTCRGSQSGTYSVFGWRTPPNGAEVISHNGATSWGTCRETSNTCTAPADPPSDDGGSSGGGGGTPSPGATFPIDKSFTSMICGPGDKGWTSVTINDQYKTQLVNYYKGLGIAGRCPEEDGFKYWLNEWQSKAGALALETFHAAGGTEGGQIGASTLRKPMPPFGQAICVRKLTPRRLATTKRGRAALMVPTTCARRPRTRSSTPTK